MTYGEYIKDRKKYKNRLKVILVILGLYAVLAMTLDSMFLTLFFMIIFFIPSLSIYNNFIESQKKKKKYKSKADFPEDMPVQLIQKKNIRGNHYWGQDVMIFPIILLFFIFVVETSSNEMMNLVHLAVILTACVGMFILLIKQNRNRLIVFEKGLILNHKLFDYESIKKMQKIKLRNHHYILELQLDKTYFSMILSEENINFFEKTMASKDVNDEVRI